MEVLGAVGTLRGAPDPAWGVREGCLEEVMLMLSLKEEQEAEGSPGQKGKERTRGWEDGRPTVGQGRNAGVHPSGPGQGVPEEMLHGVTEGSPHQKGRARAGSRDAASCQAGRSQSDLDGAAV